MGIFGSGQRKTFDGKNGVKITKPLKVPLDTQLYRLAELEVLVGFPEGGEARPPDENGGSSDMTNAALGYIHDNGVPEQNIPARPFMTPGVERVRKELTAKLGQIAKAATKENAPPDVVAVGLTQVGLIAQASIKRQITDGIGPPLSEATLRARARKKKNSKGARMELAARKAGAAPSLDLAKPLLDTNEMYKAINYVIRPRKKRK